MAEYEYKVIKAPRTAERVKGVRGHDNRFAYTLADVMNDMAADGWEYFRAETLPVEEKSGIISTKTTEKYLSLLIFRRVVENKAAATTPRLRTDRDIEYRAGVGGQTKDVVLSRPSAPAAEEQSEPKRDPMRLTRPEQVEDAATGVDESSDNNLETDR